MRTIVSRIRFENATDGDLFGEEVGIRFTEGEPSLKTISWWKSSTSRSPFLAAWLRGACRRGVELCNRRTFAASSGGCSPAPFVVFVASTDSRSRSRGSPVIGSADSRHVPALSRIGFFWRFIAWKDNRPRNCRRPPPLQTGRRNRRCSGSTHRLIVNAAAEAARRSVGRGETKEAERHFAAIPTPIENDHGPERVDELEGGLRVPRQGPSSDHPSLRSRTHQAGGRRVGSRQVPAIQPRQRRHDRFGSQPSGGGAASQAESRRS